jgi:uncharacterized MAPEG superfamily protein
MLGGHAQAVALRGPRSATTVRFTLGEAAINPTLSALGGFVTWTLLLLVLMEVIRTRLVVLQVVPPNGFTPDNGNLSPFMQRLARAHANCVEGLPVFGGLMAVSLLAGKSSITDSLAYAFLTARIVQSVVHLWSVSAAAVTLRFTAFAIQMAIGLYWAVRLLIFCCTGALGSSSS